MEIIISPSKSNVSVAITVILLRLCVFVKKNGAMCVTMNSGADDCRRGVFMKKILFYTDVLPFLSRDIDAINKLKRNLEIFKTASENLRLVWHPWVGTEEYLKINRSKVSGDYKRIVERFCQEGWGEFDASDTYQKARDVLFECDAYYGDPSDLAYEAQAAKKPVMLQNIDI